MRYLLVVGALSLFLGGCGSQPKHQLAKQEVSAPSPLLLSDELLKANAASLDDLFKAWILPFEGARDGAVPHANHKALLASEAAVQDGFRRFCSLKGGEVKVSGEQHACTTPSSEFVGEVVITKYRENKLGVTFDSPARRARLEAKKRRFEERSAFNGPSGWLETSEGRLRFLRVGNLKSRQALQFEMGPQGLSIDGDDLLKIEFPQCCDIIVTLRNGTTAKANMVALTYWRGFNMLSTYGSDGMPFVVVDPVSGQPYTRLLSPLTGIKSIAFDPPASWKDKRLEELKTTFDPRSDEVFSAYLEKLRAQASARYRDAERKGWLQMLPDGKLTPRLSTHLEYELRRIGHGHECRGDAVSGLMSVDGLQKCREAKKELDIIVKNGYSLATSVTPLATLIVLEKIQRDLN